MAQSCLLLGTAIPHTATTASHSLLPRPYLRAWRRAPPQPDRAASGWGRSARPARRRRASHAPSNAAADTSPQQSQPKGLWSSAVTQDAAARVEAALANAVERALAGWPAGAAPELAVVFVSSAFQREYERVLPVLRGMVPSLRHIVGCSGWGVIGMHHNTPEEWEGQPALSVALATLPGVAVRSFHVAPGSLPDADAPPEAWHARLGVDPSPERGHTSFVLLSDAAYGEVVDLLSGLDYAFPTAQKAGGLNSAATTSTPRAVWQWSADEDPQGTSNGLRGAGCVGLVLQGPILMDTTVAQGCRPLGDGRVFTVSRAHKSLVLELQPEGAPGSRAAKAEALSPLAVVQQQLSRLPAEQRDSAARNLMVGVAPDDWKPSAELGPGDFLVRQILGADQGSGALMVGDVLRLGQRLRFMVRDRQGAMHDLVSHGVDLKKRELSAQLAGAPLPPPLGCLIFTCNGRGRGLYREPHYDSRTLAEYVPAPSAGFFCNGEIGQVGASTYLHGFTCSAAVFRYPAAGQAQQGQQAEQLGAEQAAQQPGAEQADPQRDA